MDRRNIWKFKKEIASILIDHDAVIFGGFVRDMILHDSHATQFYEKNPNATQQEYADDSVHPQTSGRLVIPRDIDCCISQQQLEAVITRT
jgi:hypothetical protein